MSIVKDLMKIRSQAPKQVAQFEQHQAFYLEMKKAGLTKQEHYDLASIGETPIKHASKPAGTV